MDIDPSDLSQKVTLSVVIPTRNRRSRLPTVLEPLLDDDKVAEIVVVVDGSDDGSIELLQKMARVEPRIVTVAHERSLGAQVARADGLERASSEVVLFLDDDVVAHPDLAAKHLRHHQLRSSLVVLGYLPVALHPPRRRGQFASYLYAEEYEGHCDFYETDPSEVLRTLWWGNVSMHRLDAMNVGLVAPGLEAAYHEDQEFGLRCLEAGLVGIFDRSLRADHQHDRDLEGFIRDARSQGVGTVYIHTRHHETIGPLDMDTFTSGLTAPLAALVRAARRQFVAATMTRALRLTIRTAGRFHQYRIEIDAARLLRRIAQRAGAEDASRLLEKGDGDIPALMREMTRRA